MRFLLAIPLLLTLALAGCATEQQKANRAAQKAEDQHKLENSRFVEQQRMHALDNAGFTGTKRWAEIAVYNPDKTFDPSRSAVGGHTYGTSPAETKDFNYGQRTLAKTFGTHDFAGSKTAWAGDMKFTTKDARTNTKFATKDAAVKTAQTKGAWDANKTAATKPLVDGKREFLGPESKKVHKAIDPASLGDWRNGGETVSYTGNTVEKYSTMKTLTIDDIRDLLNKNK